MTTDTTTTNHDGERDAQGRFLAGNQTSRRGGNPLAARAHELASAVRGAVSAEDLADVMRSMVELAKKGDAIAARLVLERCIGKAGEERTGTGIVLPELDSAAGIGEAMRIVAHALAAGQIGIPESQAVVSTLARVVEIDVLAGIEARLRRIEERKAS